MANDRAFLYCPECNAHTLLFKTMADGWYPRGPEFLPQIEEWLDEHKTCQWPWAPGSSAPPLHIRYECAEPKLPEGSKAGLAQSPEPRAHAIERAGAAAMASLVEQWHAGLQPEDAAKHARLVERLRMSITQPPERVYMIVGESGVPEYHGLPEGEPVPIAPAPAWTREAPKGARGGWYWMRDGSDAAPEVVQVHGDALERTGYDFADEIRDRYEFWPVPIPEPPQ